MASEASASGDAHHGVGRKIADLERELAEAHRREAATAAVLKAISRSAFNLQQVLDSLIASAVQLTGADTGLIIRQDGDVYRAAAIYGASPEFIETAKQNAIPGGRQSATGRAVLERRVVHIHDVLNDRDYTWVARQAAGVRTILAVPMLTGDFVVGVIGCGRREVRPFTAKEIALVQTFADQATIAIQNTRLFEEVQARTRELARSVEELEIASQHKSQFVANMSHELRTPLAAVLGYAELLQEGIYGALPEKSLPILTRIRSNGKHLLGLINTVLDISKIEAGQFKLNLAEYALGSIVETVMVATESLASTKKLDFKTEVAKGLPYGLGDEQRLTQVLLNLVGNAIKFTDAGEVRITAGAEDGRFELSVSDTGPGIPPEERERIFEKFRQIDGSNTRAKGGTGLGLAIAREIVQMHGGRIWVESTLGQGSTFHMELPIRAAAVDGVP
jgi:signal transduction histidine kinase